MIVDIAIAIAAGVVTVGGPCVLPLLPIVLGSGLASRHPWRPVAIVAGFTLSFAFFAGLFSLFGSLLGLRVSTWRAVAAVLIAAFGLVMLFPSLQARLLRRLEPLTSRFQPKGATNQSDLKSGLALGLTLGVVWTPCAGPALAAILTLIASHHQLARGGTLLLAFALGAGLPMLLIAYGGQLAARRVRAIAPHALTIQRFFGAIILVAGLVMFTGADQPLHLWASRILAPLGSPDVGLMCSN